VLTDIVAGQTPLTGNGACVTSGNGGRGPSKKDRREHARETARLQREEAKRKARQRRWWIQGSIAVVVVAILAVVGLVIYNGVQPAGPGPKNMASNGILLTSTTKASASPGLASGEKPITSDQSDKNLAHITTYIDYQCPYCDQFETTNATQIGQWLDAGIATLEIHPLAILDASSSGTKYSSRSANAAACVANYKPSAYFKMNSALFKNQPKEGSDGLTDAKILSILKGAGASSSSITDCVNGNKFSSWVTSSTQRALKGPIPNSSVKAITGTPTILVNGQQYQGSLTDATAFATFVEGIMTGGSSTSTPAPTGTPAPESTPNQ
jgi:protein-disulfide isomerase